MIDVKSSISTSVSIADVLLRGQEAAAAAALMPMLQESGVADGIEVQVDVVPRTFDYLATATWSHAAHTGVVLDESDRQVISLALWKLKHERPGWDYMIGEIEKKLGGSYQWPAQSALRGPESFLGISIEEKVAGGD
jgi:hypothetical protein